MATQLCVAVYSTEANNRAQYTIETLRNFIDTVNFNVHRLVISDNGSCEGVQKFYEDFRKVFDLLFPSENLVIIKNRQNLGTSGAINLAIKTAPDGWNLIKADDDIKFYQKDWVEEMEEVFIRQPKVGIVGMKRRDLEQMPNHPQEVYRTEIILLPRQKGMSWLYVEQSKDIIGTCTMINPLLFKKIGYYFQPSQYAFDDALYSVRSELAGFANVFLPHIRIDHLDTGVLEGGEKTDFIIWKQQEAGRKMQEFSNAVQEYRNGKRPLSYNPFTDNENI